MSDLRASQKAQNLARIRDNQRRSRARRKEYLQELEAKLRSCEQVGIETSSEIQIAARKVLDENKKLRALLHERGVSEPDILLVLGGPSEKSYDQVSAAPTLNAMLERRVTCSTLSSTSSPAPPYLRTNSMPSVSAINIPAPRPSTISCYDSPSPSSIVSSMGTPPPVTYSAPLYTSSVTPVAEVKSEDMQYNYSYDQSYNATTWPYHNEYSMSTEQASYYNTSSCVDAANIIRTMRSDAGPELEADLGCHPQEQECYINNNLVFNMMDKYSNQNHTI